MNFSKLSTIIEQHRPLTSLSSLPFIICSNGINQVKWFNYYLEQIDTNLTIFIQSVFTVDEAMQVNEVKSNIQLNVAIKSVDEPKINEREYITSLENILNDFNEEKMNALIAKAEIQPLLSAYSMVANFNKV